MFTKHLTAKTAAAAAAVLALGAAGAAALPDASEDGLTTANEHANVTVPQSDNEHRADQSDDEATTDDESTENTESTEDTTENGAENGAEHPDNHGGTVSELARTTDAEGADKGALIASTASDGRSEARGESGAHGQ